MRMKKYDTYHCIYFNPFYCDTVTFETLNKEYKYSMNVLECNDLMHKLYDNYWVYKISKYIQILEEWNECKGFDDVNESPSVINDIKDTMDALKLVIGEGKKGDFKLLKNDLQELIKFFEKHKLDGIRIYNS